MKSRLNESNKLIQSVYNCKVMGHGEPSYYMSPAEDLATSVVENAIYDYKYGCWALIQVVGKKKAKTIANNFSELCGSFSMQYYYRRSASKDVFVRAGAKKAILYALLYEIEKSTGKKIRGNVVLNAALQNMFDAEMFFRENDWCRDLCGIGGIDILRMIKESEGLISQKKQVA